MSTDRSTGDYSYLKRPTFTRTSLHGTRVSIPAPEVRAQGHRLSTVGTEIRPGLFQKYEEVQI